MKLNNLQIDKMLVQKLIIQQFPHWSNLPICLIEPGGHDNRTFYFGDTMSISLNSAKF